MPKDKQQIVDEYLQNVQFLEYLEDECISPDAGADAIYPYTVKFDVETHPIVNDGNVSV